MPPTYKETLLLTQLLQTQPLLPMSVHSRLGIPCCLQHGWSQGVTEILFIGSAL